MCHYRLALQFFSVLRTAFDLVRPFRESMKEIFRSEFIEGWFGTFEEEFRHRLAP